ncbi:hypothetical protein HQN64_23925 [Enterobacteriaceae bacterium BIT-l23]|uniref:hypothetical protein n=1 Tax=Jejubacter sp. L23 TaxID=3092086 RepID=UPI0015852E2C|nr:hypothetical protein [Enterobacteriaceae bacterium BIT-l23]
MDKLKAKQDDLFVEDITLPTAGIVMEPGGDKFWTCSANQIETISVYQVDINSGTASAPVTLTNDKSETMAGVYIALQTDNDTVNNVWVTTYGSEAGQNLFYFDPSTPGTVNKVNISDDLSNLRDILWDENSQLLWVCDDLKGIFTIDPKTSAIANGPDKSNDVRRLALTSVNSESRIWFTFASEEERYKVGYYDKDFKRYELEETVNNIPYSLAADHEGKNLWMVLENGEVWHISDADADTPAKMKLESITSFARPAQQILCDIHGYLWVTLNGDPDSSVKPGLAECMPNGRVKGYYELQNANDAYDIAYDKNSDTFYLTDQYDTQSAKKSITAFQPADWYNPTGPKYTLTAPEQIETPSTEQYPNWTVTVTKDTPPLQLNDQPPTEDVWVDFMIYEPSVGTFKDGNGKHVTGIPIKATANDGNITVDSLYALGENGTTFNVYANIRGQTDGKVVTARIFAPVTAVDIIEGGTINVHEQKESTTDLIVQIESDPNSLSKRGVTFSVTDPNVLLSDGTGTPGSSQTIYTNSQGVASVHVVGGKNAADNVPVTVVCAGKQPATPPVVNVRPMPTTLGLQDPSTWTCRPGSEAVTPFVITLTGAAAGEAIDLDFEHYGDDASSAHLYDNINKKPVDHSSLKGLLVTDSSGTVTLAKTETYGIFCGKNMKSLVVTVNYESEDPTLTNSETYAVKI